MGQQRLSPPLIHSLRRRELSVKNHQLFLQSLPLPWSWLHVVVVELMAIQ
jgi:hypothetical protein